MAFNDAAKNAMVNAVKALIPYVSAHSASPGTTGTSELTGGAYARKSITWGATAAGVVAASNVPLIDVPAGGTVHSIGLWSAVTAGTFYGFGSLATAQAFASAGVFSVDTTTLSVTD